MSRRSVVIHFGEKLQISAIVWTHYQSQFYSLVSSVSCNVIVTSAHLYSIVTPLIDIITAIDLRLFRSLLLSPSVFLWIVCSGARFITWIGNWTIKTRTIFSIVKSGNQTKHIYFQHQRLTLLLLAPPPPPVSWTPTYRSIFRQNRRHSGLCRHTHTACGYISRLCTSTGSWSTSSRLNNKQSDRLQCYV